MSERPDRLRGGRETSFGSAQAKRVVGRLIRLVDGDKGHRINRSNDAEATTSQVAAS